MDQSEVIERLNDWERRLRDLVRTLREWSERLEDASYRDFLEGAILQVREQMLEEYNVPSRMLPHCAVLFDSNRVSFVPGPLWILGANGRVNATTNKQQYVLVDIGGKGGAPSDWQIVTSRLTNTYRPFTERIFRELVVDQELSAA